MSFTLCIQLIVTTDCRPIQAQQCWTILLTTLNNVGIKKLFNAAFNKLIVFSCVNPIELLQFNGKS